MSNDPRLYLPRKEACGQELNQFGEYLQLRKPGRGPYQDLVHQRQAVMRQELRQLQAQEQAQVPELILQPIQLLHSLHRFQWRRKDELGHYRKPRVRQLPWQLTIGVLCIGTL